MWTGNGCPTASSQGYSDHLELADMGQERQSSEGRKNVQKNKKILLTLL
jgi:hypothetical protein